MKDIIQIIRKGLLAGIMIGIGDVINAMCENKVMGALLFGLGLLCILHNGMYLYTGKIGMIWNAKDKKQEVLNLIVGFICNVLGVMLVVAMYRAVSPEFNSTIATTVEKLNAASISNCFVGGVFCGILMTVAAMSYRKENMVAETVITLFCVMVFILSGFKHCIANASMLTFGGINIVNYIMMVLGNTIGSLIFGGIYLYRGKSDEEK